VRLLAKLIFPPLMIKIASLEYSINRRYFSSDLLRASSASLLGVMSLETTATAMTRSGWVESRTGLKVRRKYRPSRKLWCSSESDRPV